MSDIFATVGVVIGLILLAVAIPLFLRTITKFFRLLGGVSDEQAKKHGLPFSKHFKIHMDNHDDANDSKGGQND